MPVSVSHALSVTTPNDPLYEAGADAWNSAHAVSLAISATEISGLFSNANGVSFGLSGNSITGSIAAGGAPGSLSAGTTRFALGEAVFSNSNGISFGLDGATVTGSHNALTSQSSQIASAGNGSFAFQSLKFSDANGLSFSTSAGGGIYGSYTVPSAPGQSVQPVAASAANGSFEFSTVSFSNLNGISFGTSAGSAITASHNALTSQSNQNASAANGGFAFQTLLFSNANGVSFATSAGSAVAASVETSYAASNHSHGNPTLALTSLSGTTASNSAGFTLSLAAGAYITTAALSNHSHGNPTLALTNLTGTTASNSAGFTLSLSAAAAGAGGAVNFSAGTTSGNLDSVVFSNSNGVSFGLNGSTITGSVGAVAGATLSMWQPNLQNLAGASRYAANGQLALFPCELPFNLVATRAHLPVSITVSTSTNSSHAGTLSMWAGLYTKNASTLSLAYSGSVTYAWTNTSNDSLSVLSGSKMFSIPMNIDATPGNYWIGVLSYSTTAGADWISFSNWMASVNNQIAAQGMFMQPLNVSKQEFRLGCGSFSTTTAVLPASIDFAAIRPNIVQRQLEPVIIFANYTV